MDNNFVFNLPTKVFFGEYEEKVGDILKELGFSRIFIVFGKNSAKKSGLLDKVCFSLNNNGIQYYLFGGARANPTFEFVKEGNVEIKKFKPDFILMIGGGSAIDAGKLMAVSSSNNVDPFDISSKKVIPTSRIPFGVILTIAASGSEMSNSCVVQDDLTHKKLGFCSELNRPLFAIENPKYYMSLSNEQTIYGIVDMLTHSMERYFCESRENEPADYLAEGVIRAIIDNGKVLLNDPNNYDARANLMILSSLSHNGITSVGKKYQLSVHQLEHALSGLYPFVAHGAGLAVLFPAWMKIYSEIDIGKFDSFSRNVFHSFLKDKSENAKIAATKIKEYFNELGAPITYNDLGIKDIDIDALVNLVTNEGTRKVDHHIQPIDKEMAKKIFLAVEE